MGNLLDKLFYKYDIWGIGIYEGEDCNKITPNSEVKNPVLTAKDVSDRKARFVADPFMIKHEDIWYMFFEIYDDVRSIGIIGVATSKDCYNWEYKKVVLEEDFHLSYPYVFKKDNEIYMMPETADSGYVKIYKAINFPYEWECTSNIIEGNYWDPSIIEHDNKYWIFAKGDKPHGDSLYLFYSESLESGWKYHPKNPIIKGDSATCRPAGRVIKYNNKMFRYSQDCSEHYGKLTRGFEVETMTTTEYKEKEIGITIQNSGKDKTWNKDGMHTVDMHREKNKWIVAVDGFYYKKVDKLSRNVEFIFTRKLNKK